MKKRMFWKFFAGFFLLSVFPGPDFLRPGRRSGPGVPPAGQGRILAQLGGAGQRRAGPVLAGSGRSGPGPFHQGKGAAGADPLYPHRLRGAGAGRLAKRSIRNAEPFRPSRDRRRHLRPLQLRDPFQLHPAREHDVFRPAAAKRRQNRRRAASEPVRPGARPGVLALARRITGLFLALLGLSLFLSLLLSRNLTRPIRELAEAARRFAAGNSDSHVHSRRRDEIGQLAADFNAMVDSQKRTGRKDPLRPAGTGNHPGVAFPTACSSSTPGSGSPAPARAFASWSATRNRWANRTGKCCALNEFDELLQKAAAGQRPRRDRDQPAPLLASLSPLPDNGGTVVTFHDLSESRRLEKQKRTSSPTFRTSCARR